MSLAPQQNGERPYAWLAHKIYLLEIEEFIPLVIAMHSIHLSEDSRIIFYSLDYCQMLFLYVTKGYAASVYRRGVMEEQEL